MSCSIIEPVNIHDWALKEHPGWRLPGDMSLREAFTRSDFDILEQIEKATDFICLVKGMEKKISTKQQRNQTIYHMKHVAENWCGVYISSAAFFASWDYMAGFGMDRVRWNADLGPCVKVKPAVIDLLDNPKDPLSTKPNKTYGGEWRITFQRETGRAS
jgi:hypothetical protein